MMRRRGFSLIELALVVSILAAVSAVTLPKFYNTSDEAINTQEVVVATAIQTGIDLYGSESIAKSRLPLYPSTLDSADDGAASLTNQFFDSIIQIGISESWEKTQLSYTGPTGQVYEYDPTLGTFNETP
jgi:prepilin-type N-terminal cleavage/methylation domain-containing protein